MEKRYRIVPPLEGIQSSSTLRDRIYTESTGDKPDHATCHEGEWVCSHGLCPVRVIRLRVKAMFYRHLPRLRCPLCLRTLDFRHWLNVVVLREVPPESPPRCHKPPSKSPVCSAARKRRGS